LNYIRRKTSRILIEILIFLAKATIFIKRFLTAFFIITIIKPGYQVLRFIFYKIVVRAYCYYLSAIKKLGWSGLRISPLSFLFNQKFIHVLVVGLTIIIVFFNLTVKVTRAGVISEKARQTVAASLVKSEFGDIESEELIEEFIDEESFFTSPAQQKYLEGQDVLRSEPQAVMTSPDEEEYQDQEAPLTQEGSAIVKPDMAATKKTKQARTEIVYHTVVSGDSVSTIAEEYEISVNTILWENSLSAYSLIRPGQKLAILPTTGLTHQVLRGENIGSISKKYGIEEDKITLINNLDDSTKLTVGQKLIIPGARKVSYVASSPSYTGLSAIADLIRPPGAIPASNKMNWPTQGYRITQYYSWRHLGVDIANKTGTPIYAADAGTVESAGWAPGYGNAIVINHGGGKKTRYGHMSKLYVQKGQKIDKGDSIGAMGSTGWSTGPHLHFEVIIGGTKYNPLNYIR